MLVFVSGSMPDGMLRGLFEEADGRDDVVFVLRGWRDIVKLGSRLKRVKGDHRVNVQVNPVLFQGYGVEAVPVFLVRKRGEWYRVTGGVSLEEAERLAGTLKDGREPVGAVYEVEEPDLLVEIERRVEEYDWDGAIERAWKRFKGRRFGYVELSPAVVEREREVDPTVVAVGDVRLPDGRVVVAAGSWVNPLDYVSLPRAVVVFNPERRCEVEFARGFGDAYFMVTSLTYDFAREFGRPVSVLIPQAVERFGLEATPSVVVQRGRRFVVREVPCRD